VKKIEFSRVSDNAQISEEKKKKKDVYLGQKNAISRNKEIYGKTGKRQRSSSDDQN